MANAKGVIMCEFPDTGKLGVEFSEKAKSDVNYKVRFRLLAVLIVLLLGVIGVVFGILFFLRKSSSGDNNDTLKNNTTRIPDGKILRSNIVKVPEIGDANSTSVADLKRQFQFINGFETPTSSNNSPNESYVPGKSEFEKKPDVSSSEDWTSFENFLEFESASDTTEDNSIIFHQPGSNVNVNKDCEKSPFDKEFVKTLTQDQRNAVERLMKKVTSNLMETFCDASSENYLVRWLKYKDWNVAEAAKALFHTLAWRKKEEIDKLETEDFSYFDEAFPVFMDGKDYDGRIVISMDTAHVDTRKIFLAGKGDQMLRYLTRMFERGLNLSREAQFRGENVTQGIMINNLQGFSMKQHACDKCIAFMFRFLTVLEEHYPSSFYKCFVINTPHEFEWVLHLAKAVLPSYIIDAIEIFGTNKQEWQKAILELVPANQIRPQFGGTKTDDDY